jgi:hypothetical protein
MHISTNPADSPPSLATLRLSPSSSPQPAFPALSSPVQASPPPTSLTLTVPAIPNADGLSLTIVLPESGSTHRVSISSDGTQSDIESITKVGPACGCALPLFFFVHIVRVFSAFH